MLPNACDWLLRLSAVCYDCLSTPNVCLLRLFFYDCLSATNACLLRMPSLRLSSSHAWLVPAYSLNPKQSAWGGVQHSRVEARHAPECLRLATATVCCLLRLSVYSERLFTTAVWLRLSVCYECLACDCLARRLPSSCRLSKPETMGREEFCAADEEEHPNPKASTLNW